MRLSLLLLLTACGGGSIKTGQDDSGDIDTTTGDADTDTDADTDADADADTDCTATIVSMTPADGATDVAIDTTVVATFSEAINAADITVDGGATGSVTIADDGMSAVFTLDDYLERDTTYTATASACGDEMSTSFTTVGEEASVSLEGRTFDLYLEDRDVEWVKPNAGTLLAGQIATNHLLFMVESATDEIDLVGAAGWETDRAGLEQYPCTYAVDFDPSSFASNPAFTSGPIDTEMAAGDTTFEVYDLTVSGVFANDGSAIEGTVVTGLIDTRPIDDYTGMDVCSLVTSFGDTCIACPDDGAEKCLELEVHDDASPYIDGFTVDATVDPTTDRYCQ